MKNNLKNIRKIPRVIERKAIKLISYFNHPLYMKLYISFLKKHDMDIGRPIYIASSVSFDGKDYSRIHVGDRTVISSGVRILTHDYSLSRAVEALNGQPLEKEIYQVKSVYIGDNCFIGARSTILPGSYIGNNVIVGAGSVIRGKIEDDSMVIGNPAIVIGNVKEWAKNNLANNNFYFND